jgi:hypothetical protein
MSRSQTALRACLCAVGLTVAIAGSSASAASAATFYVNGGVSTSGDCLSTANPCKTINEAVLKARLATASTIEVAPGNYTEDLALNNAADAGLTINGAGSGASSGTIVTGVSGKPTVEIEASGPSTTTLSNLRVVNPASDEEFAILSQFVPLALESVTVNLLDNSDLNTAIETQDVADTFNKLTVTGVWFGAAIQSEGSVSISDSNLTSNSSTVILDPGTLGGGHQDLISKSTIQGSPSASSSVVANSSDLTIDSSLLLGGSDYAIYWTQDGAKERALTIAGSTIDAGTLGVNDAPTVSDVYAEVAGSSNPIGNVRIEGSILMEQQTALLGGKGNQLTISCNNSDVPSQTQATDEASKGTIACSSDVNGNTSSSPESLFVAPGTNYNLLPGSTAIDSVPAGAISLPFGLTPSPTDVAGNPRVVDGNGDCVAVQDKGALELQGHSAACPSSPTPPLVACATSSGGCPPSPAPPLVTCAASSGDSCPPFGHLVVPVITALKISPSSFLVAPSGSAISTVGGTKKKTYGATVTYNDSQAAATTFTVLSETPGRMQGKSCRKPSSSNKHGKRCTISKAIGSFAHTDTVGANRLHFSGRLGTKKLAKGSYKLQAVPRGNIGSGTTASTRFKISG